MKAVLSLGSNLDNPYRQVQKANSVINNHSNIDIIKQSQIIATKPYGYLDQPDFYNQVVEIETSLSPHQLLQAVKQIENELGRVKSFHWGPRKIDIDILLFGNHIIKADDLCIPHSELTNRLFLLELLDQICPEYIHPIENRTIHQILHSKLVNGGL